MPKQISHLNQFHGGLNTNADARDIADNELDEATGVNVSSLGRIKILGDDVSHGEVPSTGDTMDGASIQPGYGLFKFSHDISGADQGAGIQGTVTHTNYLMLADADSSNSIHIYSSHSDQWGHDVISIGGDESASNNMKPCFYYINGAVRISDGNFSTDNFNTNLWYGYIDRELFQETGGTTITINNWYKSGTDLVAPNISDINIGEFSSTDVSAVGEYGAGSDASYSNVPAIHGALNNLATKHLLGDGAANTTATAYNVAYSTTKGVLTVDDTTPSHTAWQASQSHTVVSQTSTDGDGTGINCSISTDGSGNATFTITFAGSGYAVDEEITFTDPGSTTNTAVIIVATISGETGDATVVIASRLLCGDTTNHFDSFDRTGKHTAGTSGTRLTDGSTFRSNNPWTASSLVGATIHNLTETSSGAITANTVNTIDVSSLSAGDADNNWDVNDVYYIGGSSTDTTAAGSVISVQYINEIEVHISTLTDINDYNGTGVKRWFYEYEVRVGEKDGNNAYWLSTGYQTWTLPETYTDDTNQDHTSPYLTGFSDCEGDGDCYVEQNQSAVITIPYQSVLDVSGGSDNLLVSVRLKSILGNYSPSGGYKGISIDRIIVRGYSGAHSDDIMWPSDNGIAITFGKSGISDAATPIWTDVADTSSWQLAASYIYDEKQESMLTQTSFPISLRDGTTEYLPQLGVAVKADGSNFNTTGYKSNWNQRITGTKVYARRIRYPGDESHQTDWNLLAEVDFIKGLIRSGTSSKWRAGYSNDNEKGWVFRLWADDLPNLPFSSYESETGYALSDKTLKAQYKTAVVIGSQVYIGNVARKLPSGEVELQPDAMYKSPYGSPDAFPDSGLVTVTSMDGDDIIKLETYADRILQFKRNSMYIINVSQGIEFIEDVHHFKGVSHYSATCKTDFGIAWVNRDGCYLYDGKRVSNLLEKQGRKVIDQSTWRDSTTDDSIIGYLPKQRQIMVLKDCFGFFRLPCSITNTSTTLTTLNTKDLYAGMSVSGTGMASGETTISSITNSTTLELAAAATNTASNRELNFKCVSDIFLYDMVTGSWVFGDSLLTDAKGKTNFEVDWNNDLIWSYTVDT